MTKISGTPQTPNKLKGISLSCLTHTVMKPTESMERWQGAPARYRNTPGAKQRFVARINGSHRSSANETTQTYSCHEKQAYPRLIFNIPKLQLQGSLFAPQLVHQVCNRPSNHIIPGSGNEGTVLANERPASWSKSCWLLIPKVTLSLTKTHLQYTKMRGNSRRHCTFTPLHPVLPVDVMQTATANWHCAIEIEEVSTSTNICKLQWSACWTHAFPSITVLARGDTWCLMMDDVPQPHCGYAAGPLRLSRPSRIWYCWRLKIHAITLPHIDQKSRNINTCQTHNHKSQTIYIWHINSAKHRATRSSLS